MTDDATFSYDRILYPNYLHPQTHPDRLATMTKFFGVDAKPVENCRVLELGCGTGSSLLSFAYDLPHSEFVGVDLSGRQITLGNVAVDAVGLKNLKLMRADIMQLDRETFGKFDYIIAHGLYSWVPDFVRDQILKICRETLTENGVAYVSYNALPGCHLRRMTREMMMFHAARFSAPQEKVAQATALLQFISQATPADKAYKNVLAEEVKNLSERNFENIFHDDLAEINHPVYFHQFVSHAARHDLKFVTEVEHFTARDISYPREVTEILEDISDDVIAYEQYLDFIDGRRFRQSLLCRAELDILPKPDEQTLRSIRIASSNKPQSEQPELATLKHEVFVGDKNKRVEINHPLTKAALSHLSRIWTRSATFDETVEAARELLHAESGEDQITAPDEEILIDNLFRIFCSGSLRFHVHEPRYTTVVGEKPEASPLARWQSENSDSISTLLCTSIVIQDKIGRELLKLLDGTRDHRQIAADLAAFISSPALDQPAEIKKTILENLPVQLENNLQNFANLCLLIS